MSSSVFFFHPGSSAVFWGVVAWANLFLVQVLVVLFRGLHVCFPACGPFPGL